MRLIVRLVVVCWFASSVMAQFPLDPGESVMTCFSDNIAGNPVAGIFDIRNPAGNAPPYPNNWNPPHSALATLGQVGEVFGIALDDASPPNIYLTSTTVYNTTVVIQNAPGTGRVFKIGSSGTPVLLATLPNTGQGLGNIAFDPAAKDLFVTNFRDGKIYRIDRNSGATVATFDPFAAFNPAFGTPNGYVQPAERIFGIAVHNGRVYYARWAPSEIYSIPTSLTGMPALEFVVPAASSAVVADIEFTTAGDMLVAERGMIGTEVRSDPHHSRAMRFTLSGTTWSLATTYGIGVGGRNASGGIDEICARDGESYIAATGDALRLDSQASIYGMQITPYAGGTVFNSFVVDADTLTGPQEQDKTQIGDVDVYNDCDECAAIVVEELLCTVDGTGDFLLNFRITNLSPLTAFHAYIVGLPLGVTATVTYFPLTGGLQQGQTSGVLQTRIHNASPGQPLPFKITLLQQNLELCCAEDVVITPPDCECAQVTSKDAPFCNFFGGYTYTFTLQNLFNGPDTSYVLITPDTPSTATFTSNVFDLTSNPLSYGDSATFTMTIGNAVPGSQVCFLISTHNDDFDECCAIRHCVTLPRHCWWEDWDFTDVFPLGNTVIDFDDGFVTIDSPTHDPGCRFPLAPDTTGVELEWQPVDALSADAFLEQRYEGTVDGGANAVIANLRTVRAGSSYELRTSFPALGSSRYDYVFLNDGVLVGSLRGVGADVPVDCIGCVEPPQTDTHFRDHLDILLPIDELHCPQVDPPGIRPPCVYTTYTMPARDFRPRGFTQVFTADEVRVYPQDGRLGDIRLSSLTFLGHGVGPVTFTGLNVDKGGGNDLDVSLNTGYDQATNTTLPPGSIDPEWRVTNILTAAVPARVVIDPVPSWQPPLPRTQWISVNANAGASVEGRDRLSFENCFSIGSGASTASLELQLRADDVITDVYLNDVRIGGGGGTFFGVPLSIAFSGTVGAGGPFRAGENCLRVEVHDFGRVNTGLNVSGNVRAVR